MAKINFLSVKPDVPATGYWDHAYLSDLFASIGEGDREVVVIPGAYQGDVIPEINKELAKFKKILVIVTSDEECKFNVTKLEHPDMILYTQYGNGGYLFPLGYAPGTRETLKAIGLENKTIPWFFSGQATHYRRKMLVSSLKEMNDGVLMATDGFAKGMNKVQYLENLARARVAPVAPGAVAVDSFRIYEALEAGCIPVADDTSPIRSAPDLYWYRLFGDVPFPVFNDYTKLPMFIDLCLKEPNSNQYIFAWWINKKNQIRERIKAELGIPEEKIAVVIPISPIPSHPDTAILEETIRTIRVHTDATILLCFDGVREEQKGMEPAYREFIGRMLWKCNFEYDKVLPVIFDKHYHQSGMMKIILQNATMPTILYVEQDTPLTPDWEIPLEKLAARIISGESNLIRFHFESLIPEPHKYLMIGEPKDDLQATQQWSQRPHLASTDFYRRVMGDYFSKDSCTFIEDRMHGICQTNPWDQFKLHIYHPEGNIKRSYHLDGRAGAAKYDDRLVY